MQLSIEMHEQFHYGTELPYGNMASFLIKSFHITLVIFLQFTIKLFQIKSVNKSIYVTYQRSRNPDVEELYREQHSLRGTATSTPCTGDSRENDMYCGLMQFLIILF